MKASIRPLIQVNLSEDLLEQTRDKAPNPQQKTEDEERVRKNDITPDPNMQDYKKEKNNSHPVASSNIAFKTLNKHFLTRAHRQRQERFNQA